MNKKIGSARVLLAVIASLAVGVGLTACSKQGTDSASSSEQVTTYALTWNVPSHATVSVDSASSLPSSVQNGTSLSFSVTVEDGYQVTSVKANSKRLTASSGKYTVKISADTTIAVEIEEIVSSIAVTTNPSKMVYFAGESVDVTGMVVTATYKTGRTAALTAGSDGYTVSPSVFVGGETSFQVVYGEKSVEVALSDRVEYLVTIDPNGGTIADSYLGSLKALSLKNYAVSSTGVVTFSYYNSLAASVALPSKDQLSKTDYEFLSWGDAPTSISNTTAASVSATATWQAQLVELESCELIAEENVPYLVIKGKYKAATEVYLYLYEGNKKISLKGDTYTGVRGDEFTCKFDLTKLASAVAEDGTSFDGAWMDIRFNATLGDREESMEIFTGDNTNLQTPCDVTTKLHLGAYNYLFAVYNNALKVYYTYSCMNYSFAMAKDGAKDYLTFSGKILDSKFFGDTLGVSAYVSAESDLYTGVIGNDGSFSIAIPLQDFVTQDTNGFFHATITDTAGAIVYGGSNKNLLVADCTTTMPTVTKGTVGGDIVSAVSYQSTVDGLVYYVGYAWDGLMIYVKDERLTFDKVDLAMKNSVVYYVVSGTYTYYGADDMKFALDLQHNSNVDGVSWDVIYPTGDATAETVSATLDTTAKTYTVAFPVSTYAAAFATSENSKWCLTVHMGMGSATRKDLKPKTIGSNSFNLGGVHYALQLDDSTWKIAALSLSKTTDPDSNPEKLYTIGAPEIKDVNGVANFVVNGTYSGYTAAEFQALAFKADLQNNPYKMTGSWDGDWTRHTFTPTITANSDGTWSASYDISAFDAYAYTAHFSAKSSSDDTADAADYKIATAMDQTTTVGSKSYELISVPGSSDGAAFWGCIGLIIKDASAPTYSIGAPEIKDVNGVATFVVNGTYSGYSADEVKALGFTADLQKNTYAMTKSWDNCDWTSYPFTPTVVANSDGTWTASYDISSLTAYYYTAHFGILTSEKKIPDYKIATALDTTVTIGSLKYELVSIPTSSDGADFWGCIGLKITAA